VQQAHQIDPATEVAHAPARSPWVQRWFDIGVQRGSHALPDLAAAVLETATPEEREAYVAGREQGKSIRAVLCFMTPRQER
jgi:hypothetical protein